MIDQHLETTNRVRLKSEDAVCVYVPHPGAVSVVALISHGVLKGNSLLMHIHHEITVHTYT